MNRSFVLIFGLMVIIAGRAHAAPEIFIEQGEAFDFQCSQFVPNSGVSDADTEKVAELLPKVQTIWEKNGRPLLLGMEKLTSRDFKRKELSVTLITCRVVVAVSHPTVVNMRPFLKMGIVGNEAILTDTIFHELTHRFLDEHFADRLDVKSKNATRLIRKYAKDGPIVLAHIHLFALEKTVYNALGRYNDWKTAEAFMRKIAEPNYVKALDIVAKEGESGFMKELR
jgi:hypothetical protein